MHMHDLSSSLVWSMAVQSVKDFRCLIEAAGVYEKLEIKRIVTKRLPSKVVYQVHNVGAVNDRCSSIICAAVDDELNRASAYDFSIDGWLYLRQLQAIRRRPAYVGIALVAQVALGIQASALMVLMLSELLQNVLQKLVPSWDKLNLYRCLSNSIHQLLYSDHNRCRVTVIAVEWAAATPG